MKRQMQWRGWVVPVVWALLAGSIARASESPIRLIVDQQRFLTGEPVILRVYVDTSAMDGKEIKFAVNRSSEKLLVRREGGRKFPALPTVYTTSANRSRSNGGLEDVIILQPVECWAALVETELEEWTKDYLMPGRYVVSVQQTLLVDKAPKAVASNTVEFSVAEPTGRSLEAWNEIKSDPMLLRLMKDRFPTVYERNPKLVLREELSPEAFRRNIEFARKYIDTPYGQFAAVNCATAASKGGPFEALVDLYPTLGRLIELRPHQDFVTQHARFLYLYLDSILEEAFDAQKGLATMNEFKRSLSSSPTLLLSEKIDQLIDSYEEDITRPGPLLLDQLEAYQKRLIDRGELPTDQAVRERRRNIALGRMDAP